MLKLRKKYKDLDFNAPNPFKQESKEFFVNQGNKAVLLIHGLTATPKSLGNLAHFFANKGLTVKNICLPGHNETLEKLRQTPFREFRKKVWHAVEELDQLDKEIYIIGHSLGASLAIDACYKYIEKVKGVVLVGTPFRFKREKIIKFLTPFYLKFFGEYYAKPWRKRKQSENFIHNQDGGYNFLPLRHVLQVMFFSKIFTKTQIKKIKQPVLLIHSNRDQITSPRSSKFLYKKLGSKRKELLVVNGYSHGPLKENYGDIYDKVFGFIKRAQKKFFVSQVIKFKTEKIKQDQLLQTSNFQPAAA